MPSPCYYVDFYLILVNFFSFIWPAGLRIHFSLKLVSSVVTKGFILLQLFKLMQFVCDNVLCLRVIHWPLCIKSNYWSCHYQSKIANDIRIENVYSMCFYPLLKLCDVMSIQHLVNCKCELLMSPCLRGFFAGGNQTLYNFLPLLHIKSFFSY